MKLNHIARAGAAAACIASLAGCSLLPPDMAMGAAPSVVTSTTPLTAVERDFVTRVAAKEVYEIEVSKLAVEKASTPMVRDFAQTLVTNHMRMSRELVSIMSAHGVAPPKGLPADRATKLHRLASLPRSDAFDNGYVRVVGIEDHRAAIQMYEKAQKNVRDRDLRAYIDRSLTILKMHLTLAQQTAAAMAG